MNGYQAPPLSRVNKVLIITLVVLFLIQSIALALGAFSLEGMLGIIPGDTFPFRLYTLLTYPWVESNLLSVLFNGLGIWFLGSELERSWGERVYLKFLFTATFLAGVLYVLLGVLLFQGTWLGGGILVGSAGLTYALCVAYAVLYPDRQFLMMFAFPVQAKWFCLIMAGVELYMGLLGGNPAAWGHLLSMGIAFLMIRYQQFSLLAWWLRSGPAKTPRDKAKGASHLRLINKDDDKPKYWH